MWKLCEDLRTVRDYLSRHLQINLASWVYTLCVFSLLTVGLKVLWLFFYNNAKFSLYVVKLSNSGIFL